jgi:hypothetical protein
MSILGPLAQLSHLPAINTTIPGTKFKFRNEEQDTTTSEACLSKGCLIGRGDYGTSIGVVYAGESYGRIAASSFLFSK